MSTCCWCTPGGPTTVKLLANYASATLSPNDVSAANDDLCYCLECVEEYHKARDEVPSLHQILWDWEVSRLVNHFEKSMREEDENDLYLVEEDRVTPLTSCYTFEKRLRVPLLEVLKYPYLLLHEHLSELCVDALCKMEEMNYSYQVVGKHPGIYLLMVHPNETIRRWAILTARNLGKVDRDDYYDIQEVLICLFKVVELGLFENPDIYSSSGVEKTRLVLLPPHLYDTSNYKNYWLGLCMLLSVLEEQAMDSLLLGPDKQNFMQSIMNTMRKQTDGEIHDPFWPVLHCFMVILDKLGSKVWGQLVDPVQAFQTIINNASYKKEIESIRQNCPRTKSEPPSDYGDGTITCSQIVYNYNPERPHKDSRLKTTACLDYCPNFYEEMQTLTDMFQYDIGRDMRLHHSTFLWFIPFVHSLMDLTGLGVAYSMVVIQHLCSEVKEVLHHAVQPCDKVSQFFIWILVTVVELSWKKKCFNTLWVSSQNWVEVVVTCAGLPSMAFASGAERDLARNGPRSLTKVSSWEPDSIQSVCMNLIRVLLKEGYQMGQKASPFLNELNLLRRSHEDWKLSPQQARELQSCLIEIIRSLWTKSSSTSSHRESPTSLFREQEGRSPGYLPQEHSIYPSPRKQGEIFQEGTLFEKKYSLDEEAKGALCGEQSHQRNSEFNLTNVKQEHKESLIHEEHMLHSTSTGGPTQKSGSFYSTLGNQNSSPNQSSFDKDFQKIDTSGKEEKPRITNPDLHQRPSSSALEEKQIPKMIAEKLKSNKADLTLKLKQFVENRKRLLGPESEKQQSIKEENQDGQEGTSRRTSRDGSSTSSCLPCKPALSLENQAKILSIKKEPRDSLAEFKSAWKSGRDAEESSTDDELNVPLTEIRKELVRKKSMVQAMEPDVDREGKLYLAARQESTLAYQNPIQRKVQGAFRSPSESKSQTLSSEAGGPSNQVIIISDTSSDEEENKVNLSRRSQEENMSESLQKDLEPNKQEVITVSSSPLMYGECESQCFEFEIEDEIYSAWQDSQLDKTAEADDVPGKSAGRSASPDLELARHLSERGDDTDGLGDDVIEKAEQELEEQVKVGKTKPKLPAQADEENVSEGSTSVCSKHFTATHDDGQKSPRQSSALASPMPLSPSSSAGLLTPSLEPTPEPRKSLAKSKWLNTAPQSPEEKRLIAKKKSAQATLSGSPGPFVVPPKKVHHFPEPTSTVEKLGLKKKPRRAAELSQRSHDVLAQLRSHGKTAGQLPEKSRKTKLIEPRRMVIRSKVLLASQERQFFRQSRSKKKEKGEDVPRAKKKTFSKSPEESTGKKSDSLKGKPNQTSSSSNHPKKLLPQHSQKDNGSDSGALEREALPSSRQETIMTDSDVPGCSTSAPGSVCSSNEVGGANSGSSSKNLSEDASGLKEDLDPEENEDDLFLTQRDVVDMELCSQMESSSSPKDLGVHPTLQDQPQAVEKCRHLGCPLKTEGAGPFCHGHSLPNPTDHVFAKPSTKKIFSSSASSRIASLTKDLETSSVQVASAKTISNPIRFAALKADEVRAKLTLANLLCPRNGNNFSTQPHSVPNSHVVGIANKMPIPRFNTGQEAHPSFAQLNSSHNQPRDHSIFTKEILKWSHDMFANFKKFGPPNHLLQAVVIVVPVKFQNYDDYFKIFFPLMMLNAFEEVTCEWLENQKLREPKSFHLTLLNFNMDLNKADFTANISQHEIETQQHPKEDDVVFLIVSEKRFYYDERDGENRVVRHVGFVTRFSQSPIHNAKKKEQQVTCHLSIQTQGNLLRIEKEVKCMVVSSLATTHRRFQALLMLNRSPLATPILSPSTPYFSPRDLNTEPEKSLPYMKDFNEGQRRAIESAYAMITQHPSSPKICLIHGPPGTGKSKVIVGLLHRILGERSGKENSVQRLNAKIKTNRVLVCAPSNAAIDNLMKKIILGFKKFREKNALGNCGDINLVRLGQLKSINSEVRKFSLDDQIDRKINKAMLGKDQDLQKKKEDLDRRLDALSRLRAMDRSEKGEKKQQLEDEICQLSKERQRLASQLKEARGRSQELKASIILESHIICCTLSTSGGVLLKSAFRRLGGDPVSCVIVDEAGQTCEVETLIPLIHGCKKLVLVGDPRQLPPTIKSLKAQDYKFDQSMIGRLCNHLKEQDQENLSGKFPVLQLTVQYRMHPDICFFPSKYIYEGILTTDTKIAEDRCSLAWPFQPYLLFDVLDSHEERENESYCNPQEVKLLVELMKVLKGKKKDISARQIGIITPYNAQKRRIQRQLDKEFGENGVGEIDTVDGFQGREKDCIIVTCVRANSPQGSIGFLRSLQRLNVTITRAKYSLFILGKLKTLMENRDWNEMIQDAQRRGNIIQTSKNTYKASAMKILKSRPFPHSGMATLERDAQEAPTALGRAKPQPLPSPDTTQRPPVSLPTPAGKRTPQETPNHRPPPVAQERPQDPRLFRRAESGLKATGCKEGQTPASRPCPTQKPSGPLTVQSRSNSVNTLGETPSCVRPVPSRAPSPSPVTLDRRFPFLNEQVKTLKDRPNYPRRTLEVSREKDDSTEPKKRRTTF
ncbi:probable helicase senataxin isoform X1 [Pantherophis guttatus]|uniref:Probable helicase senataxin isoform X1 n=2 Tax=Pantherophis guttatus TaxID=94885 RepID=A0ABM3YWR8_PANGU|nr:probable helicase senataxin isoform X1 [Pantherophis guttatus]